MFEALAREDSEKALPSKPAVWRTYLLERKRRFSRGEKGGKDGRDSRGEVRVGHCRSVFAAENQVRSK